MKRLAFLMVVALALCSLPAIAADEMKAAEQRAKIDEIAQEALDHVMEKAEKAPDLFEKAYGWAAFDNIKISLFISGGGGKGVAVNKATGDRTYMNMGTAGLNIGLGGQKYQVVFLFQDEKTFNNFVEKGWKAEAQANAAAGTAGANTGATFTNGMAYWQITEAGLMVQADIAGTKYWKAKKLN